jgi:hypothetical protein
MPAVPCVIVFFLQQEYNQLIQHATRYGNHWICLYSGKHMTTRDIAHPVQGEERATVVVTHIYCPCCHKDPVLAAIQSIKRSSLVQAVAAAAAHA